MFGQSSVLAAVQIANDLQNVSLLGTLIDDLSEEELNRCEAFVKPKVDRIMQQRQEQRKKALGESEPSLLR